MTFTLDLGPAYAQALYVTAGSLTGTAPGIPVAPGVDRAAGLRCLDQLDDHLPQPPPYSGMLGFLDAQGVGPDAPDVPAGPPARVAGAMAWHASLALGNPWQASNAVTLTAVP